MLVAAAIVAALPGVGSADTDEGASLAFTYHCVTCHGQKGVANSDRYPNLAGQNALGVILGSGTRLGPPL